MVDLCLGAGFSVDPTAHAVSSSNTYGGPSIHGGSPGLQGYMQVGWGYTGQLPSAVLGLAVLAHQVLAYM